MIKSCRNYAGVYCPVDTLRESSRSCRTSLCSAAPGPVRFWFGLVNPRWTAGDCWPRTWICCYNGLHASGFRLSTKIFELAHKDPQQQEWAFHKAGSTLLSENIIIRCGLERPQDRFMLDSKGLWTNHRYLGGRFAKPKLTNHISRGLTLYLHTYIFEEAQGSYRMCIGSVASL